MKRRIADLKPPLPCLKSIHPNHFMQYLPQGYTMHVTNLGFAIGSWERFAHRVADVVINRSIFEKMFAKQGESPMDVRWSYIDETK